MHPVNALNSVEKMVVVRLYGKLGALFGREHRLAVSSVREAVRALTIMLPGFERWLETSQERGVAYTVFNGKRNLDEQDLKLNGVHDVIRIAPVTIGSKKAGVFSVILGAALIAAAIWLPGIGIAASNFMFKVGVGLALGGVSQMLSPSGTRGMTTTEDTRKSYSFGAPANQAAAGSCVPVLYGEREAGGVLISGGIYAEQQQ